MPVRKMFRIVVQKGFFRLLGGYVAKYYYLCKDITTSSGASRVRNRNNDMMKELIETIVEAIDDKKGRGIVSLDLTGFDGAICSHFVVCNADSTTQVAAIAAGIEEKVAERLGEQPWRIEGQQNAFWIAMDYTDVIVHIFQTELRSYYKLEELWGDAPMTHYGGEE